MTPSKQCHRIPYALVKESLHSKQVTENFTVWLNFKMQETRLCFPDPVLKSSLILCCTLIHWIIEKARESQKTSTSAVLVMPKPLPV